MNDVAHDDQPTDPDLGTGRLTDTGESSGEGEDDEALGAFVIALAGLAGALVVVSLIGLITYRPRKSFVHRHPLLAEVLHVGRHPF